MQPLNNIDEISDSIDLFLDEYWLPLHSFAGNKILFHYTNLEVIMNILTNRSIWLSSIMTLSDSKELTYGKDLVLKELTLSLVAETDPQ